jgi:hypothetical protein
MAPVLNDTPSYSFAGQSADPSARIKKARSKVISYRAGVALLICFLIGIAAAALLLYTLL